MNHMARNAKIWPISLHRTSTYRLDSNLQSPSTNMGVSDTPQVIYLLLTEKIERGKVFHSDSLRAHSNSYRMRLSAMGEIVFILWYHDVNITQDRNLKVPKHTETITTPLHLKLTNDVMKAWSGVPEYRKETSYSLNLRQRSFSSRMFGAYW